MAAQPISAVDAADVSQLRCQALTGVPLTRASPA